MSDELQPSRILDIAPDQLTAEQKVAVDALLKGRGRLLTPYRIWLHSPELMRAMEQLGTFLNKRCSLNEREVELGICLIAHHWAGEYVFEVHARTCVTLGFPPAVIEAIRNNAVPDLSNPRERAIYDIATIAAQKGAGSDQSFGHALNALGRNGLAELLCLFGYYTAVAIAVKLHRVPVPAAG